MEFNEKLQKLRKEHNITQEGLADKLNVSRQAVSKWESGSAYPDMEKLISLSRIFNISLDDLVNDKELVSKEKCVKKMDFKDMIDNDAALLMEEIQRVTARKTAELEEKIISMGENQPTVIRQITQNGEKSVYVEKNIGTININ